jgi:hypothetical protein
MARASVPPLRVCKSVPDFYIDGLLTHLFHSKTSPFLSEILSREKQSPAGDFFTFIGQNDAHSCFLKPVNRESKPGSREFVFISREDEPYSRENETNSREMEPYSQEFNFISREMDSVSREIKIYLER